MRYVTALPVFAGLLVLDAVVLALCIALVGLFVIEMTDDFPWSVSFADAVWLKRP